MSNISYNDRTIKIFYGDKTVGDYNVSKHICIYDSSVSEAERIHLNELMPLIGAMFEYGMPEGTQLQILKNKYLNELRKGHFPWIPESSLFSTGEITKKIYSPIPCIPSKQVFLSTDISPECFYNSVSSERSVLPSFSGCNDKFPAVLYNDNGFYKVRLPQENEYGNIIVKTSVNDGKFTSENEYICMQTAQRCGVKVPGTWLCIDSGGNAHYCVERFGLTVKNNILYRENMVDMLGMMNVRAKDKYKVTLNELFSCADMLLNRDDFADFVRMWYFGYKIGNSDMHPKNFTLFIRNKGQFKLSPAYDMLNTVVLGYTKNPCLEVTGTGELNRAKAVKAFISKYLFTHEMMSIENCIHLSAPLVTDKAFSMLEDFAPEKGPLMNIMRNKMLMYFKSVVN